MSTDTDLQNGFYWFKAERAHLRSIVQLVNGEWYTVNEAGPVPLAELNRRGWYLDHRVSPRKENGSRRKKTDADR